MIYISPRLKWISIDSNVTSNRYVSSIYKYVDENEFPAYRKHRIPKNSLLLCERHFIFSVIAEPPSYTSVRAVIDKLSNGLDNLSNFKYQTVTTQYASCDYFRIGNIGFVYTRVSNIAPVQGGVIAEHPSWFRPKINISYHSPEAYGTNVVRVDYSVIKLYYRYNIGENSEGYSFHSLVLED